MKVKDFLTEDKWTKEIWFKYNGIRHVFPREEWTPENFNGQCCLDGAIELCYKDKAQQENIKDKVFSYLAEKKQAINGIPSFNDLPTTTFKDIKELVEQLDI